MVDRRSFLRGLVTLPLIGGGLALIGKPSGADVPVSATLLDRYAAFLAIEFRETIIEVRQLHHASRPDWAPAIRESAERTMYAPDWPWLREELSGGNPSSRAAVVLSTAGVRVSDLRGWHG